MYKNESLKKYLDDLSAKLPAPGGGSASAMAAAMGAGLLSMVINFTLGKPKYARHEKDMAKLLDETEKFRLEFLRLVDLDVIAYKSKNLREAFDVPLLVARFCFQASRYCLILLKKGNANLITDVAVAIDLLEAAFSSAYWNVKINLKFLKDKSLSRKTKVELDKKLKTIRKIKQTVEVEVGKIIGG
jgi:formiminotetrahydrofolate cyclodeaminase